jgi:hypothetical protein
MQTGMIRGMLGGSRVVVELTAWTLITINTLELAVALKARRAMRQDLNDVMPHLLTLAQHTGNACTVQQTESVQQSKAGSFS